MRYLRGLQFVGSIRIELSSYEADIIFTSTNKITAREYDHIAGRISHGDPWWLAAAVVLEAGSYGGYMILFRGIFVRGGSPIAADRSV